MSVLSKLLIVLAIFAAGSAMGLKWQLGVQARAELVAAGARKADSLRQIRVADKAAAHHASTLASINNQLGTAREKIATLSGRECLGAGTVGMLNSIGGEPVRAAADEPEGAPPAAATGGGIRFATERDTASAIAICRARYAEVSEQINAVLDIEDGRHKGD